MSNSPFEKTPALSQINLIACACSSANNSAGKASVRHFACSTSSWVTLRAAIPDIASGLESTPTTCKEGTGPHTSTLEVMPKSWPLCKSNGLSIKFNTLTYECSASASKSVCATTTSSTISKGPVSQKLGPTCQVGRKISTGTSAWTLGGIVNQHKRKPCSVSRWCRRIQSSHS